MKKIIFSLLAVAVLLTRMSHSIQSVPDDDSLEATDAAEPVFISAKALMEHDISEFVTPEPEVTSVSEADIQLLSLLTMAEAEGESEEGQRLVIDVVLNRVDDPHFPDTIYEVVYQKNQFSGMCEERVSRCYVMNELVQLVREELEHRTNYDVVYFRTEHYHSYGVPLFQVGAHYFSSYD